MVAVPFEIGVTILSEILTIPVGDTEYDKSSVVLEGINVAVNTCDS